MSVTHVVLLSDEIQKYKMGDIHKGNIQTCMLQINGQHHGKHEKNKDRISIQNTTYNIKTEQHTIHKKTERKADPTSHATPVVKEL